MLFNFKVLLAFAISGGLAGYFAKVIDQTYPNFPVPFSVVFGILLGISVVPVMLWAQRRATSKKDQDK